MVTGRSFADGVLIREDPTTRKLQFAFVPNARLQVKLEQYPSLNDFNYRMIEMADHYLQAALSGQLEGTYHILLSKIQNFSGDDGLISEDMLAEMLADRTEISYTEIYEGELYLSLDEPYIIREDDSKLRKLTQQEVDIMCAYHTLWLNGVGGEQADFTGCLLQGIDLSNRNLESAILVDAKISDCKLDHVNLSRANCMNLRIYNCVILDMTAEETDFCCAQIKSTELTRCMFTDSSFADAQFQDCYAGTSRFPCATFDGAVIKDSDIPQGSYAQDIRDSQQWENTLSNQGLQM